jgi:hypothetical protein
MIHLDSVEILAAVRRSLEAHVLPELSDDFARVQVHAALKTLAEVGDRLENGDPCERSNRIIESGVRELAESIRSEDPAFAAKLDAALSAAPDEGPPRERARRLGESLWTLVSGNDAPAAARLLELLRQEALRTVGEDNTWMCGEAIASLT